MSMILKNNMAAQVSLGELNKNISKLGQALAKVSSGMKINSAGDDSAQFAISEVMRVRIRALEQDIQNVQTGSNMLQVAEGGIQEQLEIVKTIREKVIDACNDTNTDEDRKTIQKELDQFYKQLDDIAYETNYNNKYLLIGNDAVTRLDVVREWDETYMKPVLQGQNVTWISTGDTAIEVPGSSLDIIPDVYPTLDGIYGPFDDFEEYQAGGIVAIENFNISSTSSENLFKGGAWGKANEVIIDLSGYDSAADLDGKGFTMKTNSTTNTRTYVFTTDPENKRYNSNVGTASNTNADSKTATEIDIRGCTSIDDVLDKMRISGYNPPFSSYSVDKDSSQIIFITDNTSYASVNNAKDIVGATAPAEERIITIKAGSPSIPAHDSYTMVSAATVDTIDVTLPGSGKVSGTVSLSGGSDPRPNPLAGMEGASPSIPGSSASLSPIDISSAADGSGFTIKYGSSASLYVKLTNGSAGFSKITDFNPTPDNTINNYYSVGKNASNATIIIPLGASSSSSSITLTINGGKLSITPNREGSYANRYSISDGVNFSYEHTTPGSPVTVSASASVAAVPAETETYVYEAVQPLANFINKKSAEDPKYAYFTIDLSKYVDNTSREDLEDLISDLTGKNFSYNNSTYISSSGYYRSYFAFFDSAVAGGSYQSLASGTPLDLNSLRQSVKNGNSIADAVKSLFNSNSQLAERVETTDSSIKIRAFNIGETGNREYVQASEGRALAHYPIDFSKYLSQHPDMKIPEDFLQKGFRAFCATDPEQWFNFSFTATVLNGAQRPVVQSNDDFKTIYIDITKATDIPSLTKAIAEQGEKALKSLNHYMHITANTETGVVTLYDQRPYSLEYMRQWLTTVQERGAKIMDGYKDNVYADVKNVYNDEEVTDHHVIAVPRKYSSLIIQHTDKADQNLRIFIPETTTKAIFAYDNHSKPITDFPVTSKEAREKLIGTPQVPGIIDMAVEYLTNANVIIGAQLSRLDFTHENVVTQNENTIASESVIRDADMAKEMTAYTKYNILTQSAQAMLAQANQSSSQVLSLLQ